MLHQQRQWKAKDTSRPIETLETEQANINEQFSNPDIYRDEPALVKILQARLKAIENEIEQAMSRWEVLERRL